MKRAGTILRKKTKMHMVKKEMLKLFPSEKRRGQVLKLKLKKIKDCAERVSFLDGGGGQRAGWGLLSNNILIQIFKVWTAIHTLENL